MPTEAAERRAAKAQQMGATLPPVDHDPLPCPRCESINTKFCYYNNYNFSQPRHFCKSCRRYWTHGGTLRDIPVGGGSRKTAKRSRTSSSSPTSSSTITTLSSGGSGSLSQPLMDPTPPTPVFVSLPSSGPLPINGGGGGSSTTTSSFTSLLSSAGPGILALGGFGLGFDDGGFGLGRGVWAFPDVGYVTGAGIPPAAHVVVGDGGDHHSGIGGGGGGSRADTWHVETGETTGFGVAANDCFSSLPELAISTPGNGLK